LTHEGGHSWPIGRAWAFYAVRVTDTGEYARYQADKTTLVHIGRVIEKRVPLIEVRLPAQLAEAAYAAWRRDEVGPLRDETAEQRQLRSWAGDLALIGAAIAERGRPERDAVVVKLDVMQLASALDAFYDSAS
jgi:hypothetical protein